MANSPSSSNTDPKPGSAERIASAAEREARNPKDLEAEIDRLRDDVAKLTRQLSETGSHSYAAAKTAAQEGVDLLRAKGEDAVAAARNNAQMIEDEVSEAVREKPLTSLAIAAAVGYFVAVLNR